MTGNEWEEKQVERKLTRCHLKTRETGAYPIRLRSRWPQCGDSQMYVKNKLTYTYLMSVKGQIPNTNVIKGSSQ